MASETGIARMNFLNVKPDSSAKSDSGRHGPRDELREIKGKKILSTAFCPSPRRKNSFKAVAIADELPFEQAPKGRN